MSMFFFFEYYEIPEATEGVYNVDLLIRNDSRTVGNKFVYLGRRFTVYTYAPPNITISDS